MQVNPEFMGLLPLDDAPVEGASLAQATYRYVELYLHQGVSLAQVARALAIGKRTLQRRLGEEGVSFREIVDKVRAARLSQLRTRGLPADDAAPALGYSDARSVRRFERRGRQA